MKIVHISHLYYPSLGGVQTYMKNISERLVRDYNDEVTVVTTNSYFGPEKTNFKKIEPKEETINGVKVIRFAYQRWHIKLFRLLLKVLRVLKINAPEEILARLNGPYSPAMKKYLKTVEANIFFASSSNYYFMRLPLWRKCNFFYFASIHLEEDERLNHITKTQLRSMNASTLYIANTHFEKERMARLGVHPDKIFVLGCGVDMAPFENVESDEVKAFKHKAGIPEHAVVAAYIGRIEKTKNVHLVIKAFEKIYQNHPEAYLLIAGTGTIYLEELQAYCNNLPEEINSRIKWITAFGFAEKLLLFNAIDILVLPSKNESFGLVFLEAWSCKKPVIGAAIGAVRDVVSNGIDGLTAEIDDVEDLSEKMGVLLSDKNLRIQLGNNGFEKVKQNFTWDTIVQKLRHCYTAAMHNEIIIQKSARKETPLTITKTHF